MRRKRLATVALAVALSSLLSLPATVTGEPRTLAPGSQGNSRPDPKEVLAALTWLDPYLDIVRTYQLGDTGAAVKRLRYWWRPATSSMSHVRLQTVSRATRLALRSEDVPPPLSADLVTAAIVLHTDAALEELEASNDLLASEHIGRAVVLLAGFAELIDAEAGHARGAVAERFTRRAWFQALAQTLQGRWKVDLANAVVEAALEQVREPDAPVLLAWGSVKEALAFGLHLWPEQATRLRTPEAFGQTTRIPGDPALHRRKALELFQRALVADPESHEANLRIGRVLMLLGRPNEGSQALEALLTHEAHAEPQLMYLAHLFLGSIRERQGRLPEALTEYRAAVAIDAIAQAARVALARALELSGAPEAVVPTLLPFLEQQGLRDPAEDAWWLYPFGRPEEGARMLRILRVAVSVQ